MMDSAKHPFTQSLAFKLHRATVLVDRAADLFLRTRFDIGYPLFSVLLLAGTMSGPTQSQIAHALDVSRASITQRLARLIERDLVRTVPDERDSRAVRVHLTAAGGSLLETAWGAMEADGDGIDDGVNVAVLSHELDTLITNAQARIAQLRTEGET